MRAKLLVIGIGALLIGCSRQLDQGSTSVAPASDQPQSHQLIVQAAQDRAVRDHPGARLSDLIYSEASGAAVCGVIQPTSGSPYRFIYSAGGYSEDLMDHFPQSTWDAMCRAGRPAG